MERQQPSFLPKQSISAGVKNVAAGANPMSLKKGIDKAVDTICKALTEMASPINTAEEIKQIATISANNDQEIGAIIADAMEKVGKDGIISVDGSKKHRHHTGCCGRDAI